MNTLQLAYKVNKLLVLLTKLGINSGWWDVYRRSAMLNWEVLEAYAGRVTQ